MKKLAFGVLAGGLSRRMGSDKSRLMIHSSSFLDAVLEAGAFLDERIVSLSMHADEAFAQGLIARGIKIVRDAVSSQGPLEGMRQILSSMQSDACLIVATDMPLLRDGFLRSVASHYSTGNLILTHEGKLEPLCGIYSRDCISVIEELQQKGLRRPMLIYERTQTSYLDLKETGFDAQVISNINSPEEYQKILAREK